MGSGVRLEGGPLDGVIHEFVMVDTLGFPDAMALPIEEDNPDGPLAWYTRDGERYIYSEEMTKTHNEQGNRE